jgi:hypothetical protein
MPGTEQRQDVLILSRHQEVKRDIALVMHTEQKRAILVGTATIQPSHRRQESMQTLFMRWGERLPTRPEMEAAPCDPKEAGELIPCEATDTAQFQNGRTRRLGLVYVHATISLGLCDEGVIPRGALVGAGGASDPEGSPHPNQ